MFRKFMYFILSVALSVAAIGCAKQSPNVGETPSATASAQASAAANESVPFQEGSNAATAMTIPAGTPISVRLQTAVSSASSTPGQRFEAVLDDPIIVNGRTVAPRGAAVIGRVLAAKSSGRLEKPGYLRIALASVDVNGKAIPVQTSSVAVQGSSHKKRNIGWIGGTSAAGALIGGLAGGGKGALIGAGAGAATGTGVAYATGKHEVGFGPERRLTFRLTQPATVG